MPNKWQDAKPAEKILALYTTLMVSDKPVSLKALSVLLGCSKQTVGRLVDQLEGSKFGQVQSFKMGKDLYYKLERPQKMPHICVNAEGLSQMALCLDFFSGFLPPNMQKAVQGAWLNTASMAPEGVETPSAGLGTSLAKGRIDYGPFEGILNTFIKAIANDRICRITYRSQRNKEAKTWNFAPKRLISYRECIYAAGFRAPDKGEKLEPIPLQLPLQRFLKCEILNRSSKRFPDPPLDASRLGIMAGDPFDVSVRFAPSAATYAAERQWSGEQRLEEMEDGGVILHIRSQSPEECISWILGFGPNAQLLEPSWLREKVRARVEAMQELYARHT